MNIKDFLNIINKYVTSKNYPHNKFVFTTSFGFVTGEIDSEDTKDPFSFQFTAINFLENKELINNAISSNSTSNSDLETLKDLEKNSIPQKFVFLKNVEITYQTGISKSFDFHLLPVSSILGVSVI